MDLEYSLPESEGMDSQPLEDLREFVRGGVKPVFSAIVSRHGRVVFEEYASGIADDSPQELYSVTKSMSSLLFGVALMRSRLGPEVLDWPLSRFLDGYTIASHDPGGRRGSILLRHVLSQTTGIKWKETGRPWGPGHDLWEMEHSPNWVDYLLSREMSSVPGVRFNYNTGVSHLVPLLAGQIAGMDPLELWRKELANVLGIGAFRWQKDPQGLLCGGKGLAMAPLDLLRIGELVRNRGKANGALLVPEWWLEESMKPQQRGHSYYGQYGFHWWVPRPDYVAAVGFGGQYLFYAKDLDLLAVFTGMLRGTDFGIPRKWFEERILPATSQA